MNFSRAKNISARGPGRLFHRLALLKNNQSYWLSVCYDIGINIILAVSLNLINGYTGQFSLGHAGFMAVGAYTAAVITNQFTGSNIVLADMVFLGALLAGGLLAAVAGLLVGIPTLRLRGDYLAIVTLGFGEIIRVIIQNMDSIGGPRGYSVMHVWTNFFWAFGIAAVCHHSTLSSRSCIPPMDAALLLCRMMKSPLLQSGINPTKYKVTAFGHRRIFRWNRRWPVRPRQQGIYFPDGFGFMKSIEIVVMVILGGMGNTPGVILAAVLLTLLPEGCAAWQTSNLIPGISAQISPKLDQQHADDHLLAAVSHFNAYPPSGTLCFQEANQLLIIWR